jgi:hypothetical protein
VLILFLSFILSTDPFGNYLFTKLIEHADNQQKQRAILQIIPDLYPVAVDMYGTQSLQKMMQHLETAQVITLFFLSFILSFILSFSIPSLSFLSFANSFTLFVVSSIER